MQQHQSLIPPLAWPVDNAAMNVLERARTEPAWRQQLVVA